MANGITFRVEPRHVGMFGAQGILAPLYQRQATKLALAEKERESQAQYEQLKALTQLRAQMERELRGPLLEAQKAYYEAQTAPLQEEEELYRQYGAATTPEKQGDILRQILIRRGVVSGETQQKERLWYNPQSGQFERTTAAGVDYGPAALWQQPSQAEQLPNIPMTWKDFAAEEDQVRQIVGRFGGEKLNSKVLSKIGIKQAGSLDNYLSKFMGGEWNRGKMDEANRILAFISDPKNTDVVQRDKQIQTIVTAIARLQRSYDPLWRERELGKQGAVTQPIDGEIGWEQFLRLGGVGPPAPAETTAVQQPIITQPVSPDTLRRVQEQQSFFRLGISRMFGR